MSMRLDNSNQPRGLLLITNVDNLCLAAVTGLHLNHLLLSSNDIGSSALAISCLQREEPCGSTQLSYHG